MQKDSLETRKRIVAALVTDHLEDELFKEVGRTVIMLSDIENLMTMMFVILSNHLDTYEAADLFYEQGSFEKRMNLLDYIVRKWNRRDEVDAWDAIYSDLFKHKGVRNLIAHQGMFRHPPDEAGKRAVSLRPPWLRKRSKGRDLDAKAIKTTGDALDRARRDLWALINTLHEEPKEQED